MKDKKADVTAQVSPSKIGKKEYDDSPKARMSVNVHNEYAMNYFTWTRTRDCVKGEAAVKSKNELYLPMPSSMMDLPKAPSNQHPWYNQRNSGDPTSIMFTQWDPNYHPVAAYSAYLSRAQFPELTQFILRGLMGLVGSAEPTIRLPKRLEYFLESSTPTGMDLLDLYMFCISEVLVSGRLPIIVDIDPATEMPIFVPYSSESFLDWKSNRSLNSNQNDVSKAVLRDVVEDPNNTDPFSDNRTVIYNVANVNEGFYSVDRYEKEIHTQTIIPTYKGTPLPYIPLVCLGSISNSLAVDPSPLAPIAQSAIHIYMKDADLSNAEFMSCNPTLVMTGVSDDAAPKTVGSGVCISLPDPDAKVFYPATDTSALSHVLSHIDNIYERAVYQGAQLLDSSKKASESAETTRLKQAASSATLVGVVNNVSKGIETLLKIAAKWMDLSKDDIDMISFKPITEFMSPTLSAQEQEALIGSWVAGAIPHADVIDNFRKAGLLRDGITNEEVLAQVAQERKERQEAMQVFASKIPNSLPEEDGKDGKDDEDDKEELDDTDNKAE